MMITTTESLPGREIKELLGIVFGPILNLFDPGKYSELVTPLVTFALIVVLFDIGYGLKWSKLKRALLSSTVLTVFAVLLTTVFVFTAAVLFFQLSWQLALLLAAIVASTDITIVYALIRDLNIGETLKETLELEATINSVIAATAAIIIVNLITLYIVP